MDVRNGNAGSVITATRIEVYSGIRDLMREAVRRVLEGYLPLISPDNSKSRDHMQLRMRDLERVKSHDGEWDPEKSCTEYLWVLVILIDSVVQHDDSSKLTTYLTAAYRVEILGLVSQLYALNPKDSFFARLSGHAS
ncbi:MAG TPA: hypothetical protein VHQ86_05855 [Candidatus Saccharimonadia bacterium]|jgi:hypothetical protein|nr:hypothetical protein [Candidatus Saccharimonadia bacterium]